MNRALGLQQCPTMSWAMGGHCLLFSDCFGEGARQEGQSTEPLGSCHRGVQVVDVCGRQLFSFTNQRGFSCEVGAGRCSISESRCCSFHGWSRLSGTRRQFWGCMVGMRSSTNTTYHVSSFSPWFWRKLPFPIPSLAPST